MKTKDSKETVSLVVHLDRDAYNRILDKQVEIAKALGKKPNKSEVANLLIKQ